MFRWTKLDWQNAFITTRFNTAFQWDTHQWQIHNAGQLQSRILWCSGKCKTRYFWSEILGRQKIIWKTHVFDTGSPIYHKSHLSFQGNQMWKAGDQAGFLNRGELRGNRAFFCFFLSSLYHYQCSYSFLTPSLISKTNTVPSSPALHTQVSNQSPQHFLATFLLTKGP